LLPLFVSLKLTLNKSEVSNKIQKPFSLAPSIFTTFHSLSAEPYPTAPEEKLNRILQELDAQHEAVRHNMLRLLIARSKVLTQKARVELAGLEEGSEDWIEDEGRERRKEEVKKSREEMLRRARLKAQRGAKTEDYVVKPGNAGFRDDVPEKTIMDVGVEVGGVAPSSRTAAEIRAKLSTALQDLVNRGVKELEAYDNHAAQSIRMYKQALGRPSGSISAAAVQSPAVMSAGSLRVGGGILKTRTVGGAEKSCDRQVQGGGGA
jgi:hypothetical protein